MSGPVKTRETLLQQIADELKRQEQSRAALADLRARARILDRKLDTRRKIIAGAGLLAHAKLNRAFHEEARKALSAAVTRPQDRALLPEFFQDSAPGNTPPARPLKAPREPPSGAAPA